ADSPSQEMIQR
nr:immunoglobulin heavy chain junction region [Homo sapiens]